MHSQNTSLQLAFPIGNVSGGSLHVSSPRPITFCLHDCIASERLTFFKQPLLMNV